MENNSLFHNGWVWLTVTLLLFYLCTILPLRVQGDRARKWMYRLILVPVSLILIFYAYPVGIELFRQLATRF